MSDILSPFAYLNGKPVSSATLKAQPEHFKVVEQLGFTFTGSGEHLMLCIRKTGENTSFVANELAKACGVKSKDVSWAGLKDRHAVTEQWFSVHLPKGETPSLTAFLTQYPSIEVIATDRHNKKLRPGDLIGNQFEIMLTDVSDVNDIEARLTQIAQMGVPSYFGAQRFGHQGNNLAEARRWGRDNVRTRNQNKRSLYLSTARSWIFNGIVSQRIEQACFNSVLLGDCVSHNGKMITVDADNIAAMTQYVAQGEASITAAMAGDNALPTTDAALTLEQPLLDQEPDLMALISGNRMRHERRPIMLKPTNLRWSITDNSVQLNFALPAGCFATALIRELANAVEAERHYPDADK